MGRRSRRIFFRFGIGCSDRMRFRRYGQRLHRGERRPISRRSRLWRFSCRFADCWARSRLHWHRYRRRFDRSQQHRVWRRWRAICLPQYLSNDQITKILQKISRYPFAIIAEHHPDPARFVGPNLDKAVGSDVRVYSDSGVYPDHPPFSLEGVEVLCRTTPSKWLLSSDEAITTYLVRNKRWEN